MQQLYLTGDGASASAAQLMNALNVPFSGFQLTPVRVGGSLRGEALHLLLPPPKPRLNDVLCRVRLTEKRLAAPAAGDGGNRRAGAVRNVQHAHAHPHRPD